MKVLIQKYINNCDVCNRAKYDRKPLKPKFQLTKTPSDINEIVHADIYINKKCYFLTFIDKFAKFAMAFQLEDRNSITIIEKLRLFFSIKGRTRKLILDNEFNSINIKDFFRKEEIEVHFTKPNSHTGNSDIERFPSTLSERIKVLEIEKPSLSTAEKVFQSIEWYNKSYHSTIKTTPLEVINGKTDKNLIKDTIQKTKEKCIGKLNRNREEFNKTQKKGYVKNYKAVRHKYEPRYRKLPLDNIHPTNLKRPNKFFRSNTSSK